MYRAVSRVEWQLLLMCHVGFVGVRFVAISLWQFGYNGLLVMVNFRWLAVDL